MTKINYPLLSKTIESRPHYYEGDENAAEAAKKLCIDFHFLIFYFFQVPFLFFHFISFPTHPQFPTIIYLFFSFFVQYTATFRSSFRLILQWQEDILNHKQMEEKIDEN